MSRIPTQASDNFEFDLIGVDKYPFLGYNSSKDKTTISPQHFIRGSKNVYKKLSGTIANRPGLKTRGASDATVAGVTSSWEWKTTLGQEYPLRVCNGKLQFESSIVTPGTPIWYDLLLTGTLASPATTMRFIFDSWMDNIALKDRLVMCRGDSSILHWSGGVALLGSVDTLAHTMTISGSKTWSEMGFSNTSTGTVAERALIVNGKEFTYSGGEDTTTLTGVMQDMSSLTAGMVIIQSVIIVLGGTGNMFPASFNADFLISFGNQIQIGSYTSRTIYQSSDSTITSGAAANILGFTNFQNSGGHVAGDPDFFMLDSPARGIGQKDGQVCIFAGNDELYLVTPNTNVTFSYTGSDGEARYVYNKIEKKILPGLGSALAHEFIDNFGGYLVWLDQKNQLRALGSFTLDSFQKPTLFSLDVQQELSEEDFTGGHLRVIQDTFYITSPIGGRDWMYQVRDTVDDKGNIVSERVWASPMVRGISRFAIIGGVIYGHSNSNPMIYQVWDTNQWHDDSPSGEPLRYASVLTMPYRSFGRRMGKWSFNKLFSMGYISNGTILYANVYFDYQGATDKQNVQVIKDANSGVQFLSVQDNSLGQGSLGDNPLGQGLNLAADNQDLLPKFLKINNLTTKPVYEAAIEIYSEDVDSQWEIICAGLNPWEALQQGVELLAA